MKPMFRLLYYFIHPIFQGVNRLFLLSFEDVAQITSYKRYYLPTVEIKNYNVTIDRKFFFDQTIKNNLIAYYSIQKIATGQGHDYITGCLLDYNYFKDGYKIIAIDLSKQQAALDADPNAIQEINFTGNINRAEVATMFCIIEEAK